MMVAQLQRKRVKFTKVANLLDEDGDTIIITHPHSEQVLTIYITKLVRKMRIAGRSGSGYFVDEIEGWVL